LFLLPRQLLLDFAFEFKRSADFFKGVAGTAGAANGDGPVIQYPPPDPLLHLNALYPVEQNFHGFSFDEAFFGDDSMIGDPKLARYEVNPDYESVNEAHRAKQPGKKEKLRPRVFAEGHKSDGNQQPHHGPDEDDFVVARFINHPLTFQQTFIDVSHGTSIKAKERESRAI